MHSQLDRFLKPSSVAVIGASRDPAKRGARAISMLLRNGFDGRIAPVNPKEETIMDLPCFRSLEDIPYDIDLALVCTPARMAPDVIAQCGRKKIPGAVILAGGFSEAGEEGAALERATVAAAREGDVRIVGPNTAGLFDAYSGCDLMGVPGVSEGAIGVLSQSGNVLLSLVAQSVMNGASGFTTFVGLGNEADVKFHEYVDFYAADERTRSLIIYLEGLKDGPSFLASARRMSAAKPIVVYKAGRTAAGESAARSHSGSLAGDYTVARGALRQAGIVVVERSDELFPVADILSRDAGRAARRVAVLSEGGGPISQAVDALVEYGLELPRLDEATERGLKEITPNATQLSNPIDAGGGTDPHPRYFAPCSEQILSDASVDALLIVGYFGAYQLRWGDSVGEAEQAAARAVVELKERFGKPIVVQCHYADFECEGIRILREGGIPVIRSIEVSARALAAVEEYHAARERLVAGGDGKPRSSIGPSEAADVVAAARADGRSALLEPEGLRLLSLHGIETPPFAILREGEAASALDPALLQVPVAAKIVSGDILHKTEVGGVMLNLRGADEIDAGCKALLARVRKARPGASIEGVMLSPMARKGIEVILGLTTDSQFGRILMFGLGGTMVEVYRDVAFCPVPLTRRDAAELVDSIKGRAVLEGVRGGPAADREKLLDLIVAFADMAGQHPEFSEIDLNPVIVDAEGYSIVDARIILSDAESPQGSQSRAPLGAVGG